MNVGGHGDRLVVILATAAAAALIVVGVLYMLTSERVKPVPKPSAETSQKNGQAPAPGGKLQYAMHPGSCELPRQLYLRD